jgi:hypothetical protein
MELLSKLEKEPSPTENIEQKMDNKDERQESGLSFH